MTITIIAQHPMWRAGRQWPQGETRVEEGLSKEALAALETDPNFSVQGAKKAKEAKTKPGADAKKPNQGEKGE